MKEDRKNRFRRLTMPLDSGSRGLSSLISVPSVPANAAVRSVSLPRPMPVSLSQSSRFGTAPAAWSSDHIPPSRSGVARDGSINAWKTPENVDVITNTGGMPSWPRPNGSGSCGNHKSHCTCLPGSCTRRSAGSGGAYSGRIPATLSRNTDADPDHPTRSASVDAGIVGVVANNTRTCGANASKLDPPAAR